MQSDEWGLHWMNWQRKLHDSNYCAGWLADDTPMAFGSLISTCNLLESDIVTVRSDAYLLWTTEIRYEPWFLKLRFKIMSKDLVICIDSIVLSLHGLWGSQNFCNLHSWHLFSASCKLLQQIIVYSFLHIHVANVIIASQHSDCLFLFASKTEQFNLELVPCREIVHWPWQKEIPKISTADWSQIQSIVVNKMGSS